MPDASPDIGLCFNRSLRRSASRLLRLYDETLAPCGLRATEFAILSMIQRETTMGLVELADAFLLDRAALRYRIQPLERAGLLALEQDPRDRRVRHLVLTEAGGAKLEEAAPLWRDAQRRFEMAFGADRAAAFKAATDFVGSSTFVDAFRA